MPLRLDKFAERLARHVDVAKQLATCCLPAGNPSVKHPYIRVAQIGQAAGSSLRLARAVIENDDRHATPGQRCPGVGLNCPSPGIGTTNFV